MRPFTTEPPADGDLSQTTDDGCLLGPDPTRSADPVGRDDLGESGTFGAPPAGAPTAPADSHWQRLQDQVVLTGRWRAACERAV